MADFVEASEEPAGSAGAARAGDLAGFEALMRRHERLVLATALRLLGNLEDAQDASQEVFLKLYRNLRKLDGANLAAWLYRVTVNVCHDTGRKRRPMEPVEDAEAVAAAPARDASEEAERHRALDLGLRRLAERERTAVVLRDLEGLSTAEVARAMGSSEATVRSQISQSRVKMRNFLEHYFGRRT
ncbi:MAG TPA: sigma-70 family RNA polymerase sigma factor [Bryobacteraceae bacterium]|nr:sigma-70 family RNA polymerase sigma factor [Bryobacteraceae bacterium]